MSPPSFTFVTLSAVQSSLKEFFSSSASPEVIRRELAMSKNEFKRAVGNLLKNGRIEITEKAIRRI